MEDEDGYKKFIRMTPEIFDELPNLIECDIKKKSTSSEILYHLTLNLL